MHISVIIPVYNAVAYLDAALESVFAQTGVTLEVIAIDDGSTDGSAAALACWQTAHGNMQVILQANAGQVAARNRGIGLATGEFIYFMDADDVLEPHAIEIMLAAADADTDVVVSGLIRGGKKRLWGEDVWQTGPSDVFNCMVAKLFRRRLFEGLVRDASVSLGEDLMVTAQLLRKARKIAVVPDAFYRYRDNPVSLTHRLDGRKRVRDLMRVDEILRQAMPEPKYADFHDRVTRDAMLLWCRYRLLDRGLWRQLRSRLHGGLLADRRHGLCKKGALFLASCLFD